MNQYVEFLWQYGKLDGDTIAYWYKDSTIPDAMCITYESTDAAFTHKWIDKHFPENPDYSFLDWSDDELQPFRYWNSVDREKCLSNQHKLLKVTVKITLFDLSVSASKYVLVRDTYDADVIARNTNQTVVSAIYKAGDKLSKLFYGRLP